jgi:hypothetical protein
VDDAEAWGVKLLLGRSRLLWRYWLHIFTRRWQRVDITVGLPKTERHCLCPRSRVVRSSSLSRCGTTRRGSGRMPLLLCHHFLGCTRACTRLGSPWSRTNPSASVWS